MKKKQPKKSEQIPVTKAMLTEVRYELKHEMTSLKFAMKSEFKRVDARFCDLDARFNQVDAKFKMVDASILDLKSDVRKVASDIHGIKLMFEEQNAKNNYVLDGYANLSDRLAKLE